MPRELPDVVTARDLPTGSVRRAAEALQLLEQSAQDGAASVTLSERRQGLPDESAKPLEPGAVVSRKPGEGQRVLLLQEPAVERPLLAAVEERQRLVPPLQVSQWPRECRAATC